MKKGLVLILVFLVPIVAHSASDPLKKVAKNLAKKITKKDKVNVGLLAFPYHDGRVSSGSSIVCERLTIHLASQKSLRIVERNLITKVLEEQRLSETGVIDPRTAKQLGNILGVDVIVTGTLIDLNEEETEVNARGFLAGTGEIIVADRTIIDRTWKDRPRISNSSVVRRAHVPKKIGGEKKKKKNEAIRIGYPATGGYGDSYGGGY